VISLVGRKYGGSEPGAFTQIITPDSASTLVRRPEQ
jgi:hypothetical protein